MTETLDFETLCKIEPKLKDLYDEVFHERKWRLKRDVNLWEHYKQIFTELVGSQIDSGDPRLQTPEAYTVVFDTIYSTMTGGRHWDHTGEVQKYAEK